MNYPLDPYASKSTGSESDMVAAYPGNMNGFLKLQAHANFYPNYTSILQEFLTVYGNPSATYVPDIVPAELIDPNAPVPTTGGGFPGPSQGQPGQPVPPQQPYIQPQTLGLQQQQQQQQQSAMGTQNIMKLVGLGAVAYVLYMVLKKK